MIAAIRRANGLDPPEATAVARALADKGGKPALRIECGGYDLFASSRGNGHTLLCGRIDNAADIIGALNLPADTRAAELYDHALRFWGDEADHRLIGHYSAITIQPSRSLRLVRSPWTAPPMHFVARNGITAASPLLGALFAAGVDQEIDWDYFADQLLYDHRDLEPVGWYKGIGRVPLGSRIILDGAHWQLTRYYDPVAVEPVRLPNDEAYIERANELLDEAARASLTGIERPAIMLSGGLDSPLAAAALLRQMPDEARLHSYTFTPHPDWDGTALTGAIGDESERVRQFAARHPRLQAHFPSPEGGHDHRLRDLLAHTHVATANVANIGIFHPLFEAAKADGCDAIFTALHGNFNFSLEADWAAPEALRRGKWKRLLGILSHLPEGQEIHPLARRILSTAALPHLPAAVQRWIRKRAHPERHNDTPIGSLASEDAIREWRKRARERGSLSVFDRPAIPASRAEAIRWMWASADSAEDLDLGMERLHGIAHRDLTAYRPLFEFCHGVPTDQLQRGGTDRYLARRMAKGILPEDQRLDTRQGYHNVDWHARMSARRDQLLATTQAISAHPNLSRLIDLGRMETLLEDWPQTTPKIRRERYPREMGISRALTAACFVSHVEKRNDF